MASYGGGSTLISNSEGRLVAGGRAIFDVDGRWAGRTGAGATALGMSRVSILTSAAGGEDLTMIAGTICPGAAVIAEDGGSRGGGSV